MQQATFANWVNEKLKSDGKIKVTDLTVDLQDGTVLIRLVENLTSKKIKGYNKAPTLAAHKLDNLELVFKLMRSSGIKIVGIGELDVLLHYEFYHIIFFMGCPLKFYIDWHCRESQHL